MSPELEARGEPPATRMNVDTEEVLGASNRRRLHSEGRRATSLPAKREVTIQHQVGYVYDEGMLMHACLAPDGHPEQPARLTRVHNALVTAKVLEKMQKLPIREVERDEALLVHSQTLWDKVLAISGTTFRLSSRFLAYEHT
jgi:histone deacetylase 6